MNLNKLKYLKHDKLRNTMNTWKHIKMWNIRKTVKNSRKTCEQLRKTHEQFRESREKLAHRWFYLYFWSCSCTSVHDIVKPASCVHAKAKQAVSSLLALPIAALFAFWRLVRKSTNFFPMFLRFFCVFAILLRFSKFLFKIAVLRRFWPSGARIFSLDGAHKTL